MERVTQKEEEEYQKGRRDGFNNASPSIPSQIYRSGWEAGALERLQAKAA